MLQRQSSVFQGYLRSIRQSDKSEPPMRHTSWRWIILILACFLIFGDAYSFDNPQALESHIEEDVNIDSVQFNLLYSVYSFPNIILPLFGGLVIDLLGVRIGVFMFSTILIVGQIIFYLGGQNSLFWLMILGRVIFGIGSESLTVSQSSIVSIWFKNKELALAIGFNQSLPKLGSALNSLVSPKLYSYNNTNSIALPLLVGVFICIFSWVCGLALIFIDYKREKSDIFKNDKEKNFINNLKGLKDEKVQSLIDGKKNKERSYTDIRADADKAAAYAPEIYSGMESENDHVEKIQLSDLKKLRFNFWVLLVICSFSEALFVPFLDNANKFYELRFGFDSSTAGNLLVIPYCVAAIITPLLGLTVDRYGKRGKLMILTTLLFLVTHILFAFLPSCNDGCFVSILPLITLGLCFSHYCAVIIPSVPVIVSEPRILGTAFGLMGIFQNTSLAIFPIIVGAIYSNYDVEDISTKQQGFIYCSYFFIGISFACFLVACLEEYLDSKGDQRLDKVNVKPKNMMKRLSWSPKRKITSRKSN